MNAMLSAENQVSAPPWALSAVIRLQPNGPEMAREPVSDADLADARGEAWLAGCLRKNKPAVPLHQLGLRLTPLFKAESAVLCSGYALESALPDAGPLRYELTTSSLDDVAARATHRLLSAGVMQQGDTYYFEVAATQRPAAIEPADSAPFTVVTASKPLAYLTVPLPPLLRRSRPVGSVDEGCYPVLYTEDALAKAEHFARKGAQRHPPVETGAMLVGPLCSCPETGEFFAVVCEVFEVLDAEENQFSLSYTGKTWSRFQAVLKGKQAQAGTRAHRLVGQCHGHNFAPAGGAPPCEVCWKVKVCSRTSVFVSQADRTWSRAVFAGQPWHLCHIFGRNARGEDVQSLFGLRDGRLLERGFHVIADFSL